MELYEVIWLFIQLYRSYIWSYGGIFGVGSYTWSYIWSYGFMEVA